MGKTLIVAEKPSVAKDIAAALGGFSKAGDALESSTAIISSAIGHLVGLDVPEAKTSGRDISSLPVIPERFNLKPIKEKTKQLGILKLLMHRQDVDQIVNVCDAGREGELIFRLAYDCVKARKPVKRMWLQSMTKASIQEAYNNLRPSSEFDGLGDAARCRAEADWLVGINVSRAATRLNELQTRAYEMCSAGRVQSPTGAIVVERELEIRNFVPQDYWEVHATFAAEAGRYVGKWFNPKAPTEAADGDTESSEEGATGNRFWDRAQAEVIATKCRGLVPTSVVDQVKPTRQSAPKLFDLASLQREANKKFKLSAKKTLDIAQSLYETHKVTTYPRTESTALPEDYAPEVQSILESCAGTAYGAHASRVLSAKWIDPSNKGIFNNAEITDHFAIIPTIENPRGLSADEEKIYDMIVRRFIAAFHPAAEYSQTTRITTIAEELFKSSGRVLVNPGWLEVYGSQAKKSKEPSLCALRDGEKPRCDSVDVKDLKTKPPARYTEGTLLGAMEGAGKLVDDAAISKAMKERGLGTAATRAAIIENLLSTKSGGRPKEPSFVREGKEQYIVPTEKGFKMYALFKDNSIEELVSPKMTGEWEYKLRLIEKGEYRRDQFMAEIGQTVHRIIDIIRDKAAEIPAPEERLLGPECPSCGSAVLSQQRTFECKSKCGFKIWREIAGRDLSDEEAKELIRTKELKPLDGFISKQKRKFSAGLRLTAEMKTELVFPDREESGSTEAAADLGVACPLCGGAVKIKTGDYAQYACEKGDFKLWKTIAGRPLSDGEAATLISTGSLPAVHGFISKKKTQFGAGLILAKGGDKVTFVFDN